MIRLAGWLSLALIVGCPAPPDSSGHAIVGGELTAAYPEVVGVAWGDEFLCSGVLVEPRTVLTVAHCLYGLSPDGDGVLVRFGADGDEPDDIVEASAVAPHPEFGVDATRDIGTVTLVQEATVSPVPWNTEAIGLDRLGEEITLVGFGRTSAADDTGLHRRRVTTVVLADLNETSLSWYDDAAGICDGDSGGPALMDLGGGPVAVGVAAEGDPDCSEWGAATRTDAFADWLAEPEEDDDDFTAAEPTPPGSGPGGCGGGNSIALLPLLVVLLPAGWRRQRRGRLGASGAACSPPPSPARVGHRPTASSAPYLDRRSHRNSQEIVRARRARSRRADEGVLDYLRTHEQALRPSSQQLCWTTD